MHNHVDTYKEASFSLANRLMRVVWGVVYVLLFRYSPLPFHGYRAFILRCFGATVGKGAHVYPPVRIWAPWTLELADECGIASGAERYSQGKITVGSRTAISHAPSARTGSHDYTNKGHPLYTKPITIGDSAWVAADCFIHPGVTIGEGAVIGARSVVTRDMPPWMVCAGHPCRPLKERMMDNK